MPAIFRNKRVNTMFTVTSLRTLSLATNLLTGMLTAWVLEPTGRGIQTALGIGVFALIGICDFGLHMSLIYNIKADPDNKAHYFGSALLLGWISGFTGIGIGWIIMPYFLRNFDEHTIHVAQMLMFFVPVGVTSSILIGVLESHNEFNFVSITGVVNCIFTLILLLIFWLTGSLSPVTASSSYLIPTVLIAFILFLRVRPILLPASPFHWIPLKRMFFYGARFFGIDFIGTISGYLDQFIMIRFLDAHAIGIYTIALSAAGVLSVIPTSISTVLFPSVAGRPKETINDIVGVTARLTSVVTSSAALFLGLFAPYILSIFYGPKFEESVTAFRILLGAGIISHTSRIFYQIYSASGRPEIVTYFEAICLLAVVIFMVTLIPQFGPNGSAMAIFLTAVIRLILVLGGLRGILGSSIPRLICNEDDIRRVFKA
ncbi:oligosaccharide flippase family protein [Beijerinckia mobilis]|uniref:oligosaccharide flippase family protein n=1 Tax=Beijerinckia mobilis TaxID=231434 RepID=UPI000554888B|nr:oligosaccharide flippase family protein [Beijerinckia mobilis]